MKRCFFLLLACGAFLVSWAQYTPPVAEKTAADTTVVRVDGALSYEGCMNRALGLLLTTDSLAQAQRYLEQALVLQPHSPSNHVVHELLGRIFTRKNQPKDALRAYNEALRLQPTYVPALTLRAQFYAEQKEWEAAYQDYTTILEHTAPSDVNLLYNTLLSRSDIAYQQGDWNKVVDDMKRVLHFRPLDLKANLRMAYAFHQQNRQEEAEMRINMMVDTYPDRYEGFVLRGHFAAERGDYDEAIEDYNAALQLAPKDGTIYAQRAAVYARQGRAHASRMDLEQARKLGCPEEVIRIFLPQ